MCTKLALLQGVKKLKNEKTAVMNKKIEQETLVISEIYNEAISQFIMYGMHAPLIFKYSLTNNENELPTMMIDGQFLFGEN